MGTIVKQSSLGLVANYIGILLGFVNVMLIMPFILKAEQIGLVNLIFAVVMIVYPILDFSATQIINRYFIVAKDKQEIFNLSFLISCTGAVVFFFIFLLGKPLFVHYYQENSPEIIPYYWWIYIVSIIMSWSALSESFGIINGKYHFTAFFREVFFRFCITVILILLLVKAIEFDTYVHLYFVMYGVAGGMILWYLKSKGLFNFHFKIPQLHTSQKKSMFKYGAFTIFTGIAAVVAIRVDMIMLGSMEGLKDVGIYTIAYFMASTIEIPKKTVTQSSAPIIRIAIKENDIDKVIQIQYKTILNLLLVGGLVLTLLMINLNDIYSIIPNGKTYEKGFLVVFFLGMAKIAEFLTGSHDDIILSSKYYVLNIVFIFILTTLTITLNYHFIPIYGLIGSAASTFLAVVLVVILKIFTFKILFKKSVYKLSFLGVFGFYILLGIILFNINVDMHPIISIFIKSSITGVLVFAFLKWTQISPDLNQLINQILKSIGIGKWIQL